jgi:hypothetical protein
MSARISAKLLAAIYVLALFAMTVATVVGWR